MFLFELLILGLKNVEVEDSPNGQPKTMSEVKTLLGPIQMQSQCMNVCMKIQMT